jgi:hypothetical protein
MRGRLMPNACEEPLKADRGDAQVEDAGHLRRHPEVVASRDGEQARLEERGQAEREHEIEGALWPPPEMPLERGNQERIHAEPEQECPQGRPEDAHGAGQMQQHDGHEGHVAADGEELAVGDIDDVEHAEDQAEPDGEERVEPAQDHALDQELEERFKHG